MNAHLFVKRRLLSDVSSLAMRLHYTNQRGEKIHVIIPACSFLQDKTAIKVTSKEEIEEFVLALQDAEVNIEK